MVSPPMADTSRGSDVSDTGENRNLFEDAGKKQVGADFKPAPDRIEKLGGPIFMLPGIASEKIHLFAAQVERPALPDRYPSPGTGDGAPLEEGAELVWRTLDDALAACLAGEIEDAKTELALRRLKDRLAANS